MSTKPLGKQKHEDERLLQALTDVGKLLVWSRSGDRAKSEVISELADLGFSPTRVAELIGWKPKDVTSVLSKRRKKGAKGNRRNR